MGFFGRDSNDSADGDSHPASCAGETDYGRDPDANADADPDPDVEVEVEVEHELEKRYTEHHATVTYADGTEDPRVFDKINRNDHGITLYDYTGLYRRTRLHGGCQTEFSVEAVAFLPYTNLRSFDTDDRIERTLEDTETETGVTMSKSEAVQRDDVTIVSDPTDTEGDQ